MSTVLNEYMMMMMMMMMIKSLQGHLIECYLISPKTLPSWSVAKTRLLFGPPTTSTCPTITMYISVPTSPYHHKPTIHSFIHSFIHFFIATNVKTHSPLHM